MTEPLTRRITWFAPWRWFAHWKPWKRWTLFVIVMLVGYIEAPVVVVPLMQVVNSGPIVSYTLPVLKIVYAPLEYLHHNVPPVREFYSAQFSIAKWVLSWIGLKSPSTP